MPYSPCRDLRRSSACFDILESTSYDLTHDNKLTYARFKVSIYQTMAEASLQAQDFAQAKHYVQLALELATGLNLAFERVGIYFTLAHLALIHHRDLDEANRYYQQAIDMVQDIQSPSYIGRFYLEEARYLQRVGWPDRSRDFARMAETIFADHHMAHDLALAQHLL